MYTSIVALPLLGALGAGFGGRWLGRRGSPALATALVMATFVLAVTAWVEVGLGGAPVHLEGGPWVQSRAFAVQWGLLFDALTVTMLVVVTGVSALVHLYAIAYMATDPHLPRFHAYLSFFTFAMVILVTGDNLLQLFLGWEGVGVASYLLINFWYTRLGANKAALKAMLCNKVGDCFLALALLALVDLTGALDYATLFGSLNAEVRRATVSLGGVEVHALSLIALLLFGGAVGKSAQLGLHPWLPDAMEGPTPVSALIHAATMVTAGVFLLARMSPLLERTPGVLNVVAVWGAATALFAGTVGVVQNDLKRVIAYSTCSQLGYMVFACGLSQYDLAVFHLATHAAFKALLFLGAGSVIHAVGDEQDMRKLGGLQTLLPFTATAMGIGTLALVGFPFLAGFYSKDPILEGAYATLTASGRFAWTLGLLAAFCTSYYSFRLVNLTFLNRANAPQAATYAGVHEAPVLMALPLGILACVSLAVGYLAKDAAMGQGTAYWGAALSLRPGASSASFEMETLPTLIKHVPLAMVAGGFLVAYAVSTRGGMAWGWAMKRRPWVQTAYAFANQRWYFDGVINAFLARPVVAWAYHGSLKALDKGAFEVFGPTGLVAGAGFLHRQVTALQTGSLQHYTLTFVVGAVALLTGLALTVTLDDPDPKLGALMNALRGSEDFWYRLFLDPSFFLRDPRFSPSGTSLSEDLNYAYTVLFTAAFMGVMAYIPVAMFRWGYHALGGTKGAQGTDLEALGTEVALDERGVVPLKPLTSHAVLNAPDPDALESVMAPTLEAAWPFQAVAMLGAFGVIALGVQRVSLRLDHTQRLQAAQAAWDGGAPADAPAVEASVRPGPRGLVREAGAWLTATVRARTAPLAAELRHAARRHGLTRGLTRGVTPSLARPAAPARASSSVPSSPVPPVDRS